MASGATCVQRLDGSRDSAIHTKYRISLRSSSMQEPRYPLPRVILYVVCRGKVRGVAVSGPAKIALNSFEFLGARSAGVCVLARGGARGDRLSPARVGEDGVGVREQLPRASPDRTCPVMNGFAGRTCCEATTMILPQVHLRKPCYDFSFL